VRRTSLVRYLSFWCTVRTRMQLAVSVGQGCARGRIYDGRVPPEFIRDDIIMRVDGDVLEILIPRTEGARRFPLAWLTVRAQPARKNNVQISIGSENVDQPLYAMAKKFKMQGNTLITYVKADEEAAYRAFFAEVAQLCGRSVSVSGF